MHEMYKDLFNNKKKVQGLEQEFQSYNQLQTAPALQISPLFKIFNHWLVLYSNNKKLKI